MINIKSYNWENNIKFKWIPASSDGFWIRTKYEKYIVFFFVELQLCKAFNLNLVLILINTSLLIYHTALCLYFYLLESRLCSHREILFVIKKFPSPELDSLKPGQTIFFVLQSVWFTLDIIFFNLFNHHFINKRINGLI